MRRRGSSKRRYSRGGAIEYLKERSDLDNYTFYNISLKNPSGSLDKLSDSEKDLLFKTYNNPEYVVQLI